MFPNSRVRKPSLLKFFCYTDLQVSSSLVENKLIARGPAEPALTGLCGRESECCVTKCLPSSMLFLTVPVIFTLFPSSVSYPTLLVASLTLYLHQ